MFAKELFVYNLKYFMKERGVNQRELARLVNVSSATVSDWVNGNKPASYDNLDRIATALKTSVSNLFIDRQTQHAYDAAEDEELRTYVQSNRDAEYIIKGMKRLSHTELRAYRNILDQVERVKNVNRSKDF